MGKVIINKNVQEEIEFAPCIKCGGHEVEFYDYGYSSFNVAVGKCSNKECGHEENFNCGCFPDKAWIVQQWHEANDIPTILKSKRLKLSALEKEMADLEALHASRQ